MRMTTLRHTGIKVYRIIIIEQHKLSPPFLFLQLLLGIIMIMTMAILQWNDSKIERRDDVNTLCIQTTCFKKLLSFISDLCLRLSWDKKRSVRNKHFCTFSMYGYKTSHLHCNILTCLLPLSNRIAFRKDAFIFPFFEFLLDMDKLQHYMYVILVKLVFFIW